MRIGVICILLFGVLSYCNAAFSEAFSGSNGEGSFANSFGGGAAAAAASSGNGGMVQHKSSRNGNGAAAAAASSGNGAYSGAFSSSNRRRPYPNSYNGAAAAAASSGNGGMAHSKSSRNGNAFSEAFSGSNGEGSLAESSGRVLQKDEPHGLQIDNPLERIEEIGKFLQVVRQGDGLPADLKNKDFSQILDILTNLEKKGKPRSSNVKGASTPASTLDSNARESFTPGSIVNTTLASATDSTLSTFFSPLIDIAVHFGLYLDFPLNDSDTSEFENKSFSQIVDMILNLKEQGITPSIDVKESAH